MKKLSKIKEGMELKAMNLQSTMASRAQLKFVHWLAKEDKISIDEAWDQCLGNSDPVNPNHTLGYKLADPVVQLALFGQLKKANRIQAAKNFSMSLSDEERELFYSKVFNEETGQKFKDALKNGKSRKGKKELMKDEMEDENTE